MNVTDYISQWEQEQERLFYCNLYMFDSNLNRERRINVLYEMKKSKEQGFISDTLGTIFIELSRKAVTTYYNNFGEELKKDMIQTGCLNACQHWHKFNPKKTHRVIPYLLCIIKSGFAKFCHREGMYKKILREMKETQIYIRGP